MPSSLILIWGWLIRVVVQFVTWRGHIRKNLGFIACETLFQHCAIQKKHRQAGVNHFQFCVKKLVADLFPFTVPLTVAVFPTYPTPVASFWSMVSWSMVIAMSVVGCICGGGGECHATSWHSRNSDGYEQWFFQYSHKGNPPWGVLRITAYAALLVQST